MGNFGRVPLLLAAWLGLGAGVHHDPEAGIRFPEPFPDAEPKTALQVQNLILDHPSAGIPDGLRYTSGLYARAGLPFLLVWVRDDDRPPTQAALRRLAGASGAEARTSLGLGEFRFDLERLMGIGRPAPRGGLRSRVLAQVARGRTVYVGLWYKTAADAALLDDVARGLEVDRAHRLRLKELPRGWPDPFGSWLAAGAFLLGAGGWLSLRVSRRPSASS